MVLVSGADWSAASSFVRPWLQRFLPIAKPAFGSMWRKGVRMDSSWKIAVAIVLSALLVIVCLIGYREYDRQRDIDMAMSMLQGLGESSQQYVQQQADYRAAEAANSAERRRRVVAEDLRRRTLEGNQRCVGGVVVQVEGSTYTQLGTISQPAYCAGGVADQPLR